MASALKDNPQLQAEEVGLTAFVDDLDRQFLMLSTTPIIANDRFDITTLKDRQELLELTKINYDTDLFSVKPTCGCGRTKDGSKVGQVCKYCGTKVTTVTDEEIESQIWLRCPTGTLGFINPQLWLIFFQNFTIKGFNPFEYYADPNYIPTKDQGDYRNKDVYKFIKTLPWARGINSLITNFDQIVQTILSSPIIASQVTAQKTLSEHYELFVKYRNEFFCKHLPMPSKLLFVVESNATGRYASQEMKLAIDAALTACNEKKVISTEKDIRFNEGISIKVVKQLAEFYKDHDANNFSKKPGLLRKNIAGAKFPWTGRCVITSYTGVHDMDEVILPRCIAIPILKFPLENKLLALGYSPTQILAMLQAGISQPIKVLDDVLDALLTENTVTRSVKVFIQRNLD